MSILVNPHNEKKEEVLLAFLKTLRYDFKADIEDIAGAFSDQYNSQLDKAEQEIEEWKFMT